MNPRPTVQSERAYLAEGGWPEREPKQGAQTELEPAPIEVVAVNQHCCHGPCKVSNRDNHPAGVDELFVHRESEPAVDELIPV